MEKVHYFSVPEASKYGVNKAIILSNFRHWLDKNKANNKNEFDGYYWTYNTSEALSEIFPYFNSKSISRWLNELEEAGVVKSSKSYNKMKFDRTKWYTILNEYCTISQNEKRESQNEETIPDRNTNNKPIKNIEKRADVFFEDVKKKWIELGGHEKYLVQAEFIAFVGYWSEHGDNDKKMRFEKEKSFGIGRRLGTWKKNYDERNPKLKSANPFLTGMN